jgi:hypothetical protein
VSDQRSADGSLDAVRARRARLGAAMGALESAIGGPAPGRLDDWTAGIHDALGRLRTALATHIAETEAPDGLLAQVVEQAPRLANAVNRLRDEHQVLAGEVDALDTLQPPANETGRGPWVTATRDQVLSFLGRLARHRHAGADLLYEAYSVDVSTAD